MKLKRGVTREVVLIGRYAIKLPSLRSWRLFLQGLLCNIQEREFSGFDERLCPVLLSVWGGFVNAMPRCVPVDDFTPEMDRICDDLTFIEKKQCSFGMMGDRLVAVDYG
jgi:hypothetical protein